MQEERNELDQSILSIYEDLELVLKRAENLPAFNDSSPYYCRLHTIKDKVETERRLLEEVSLPCRFLLEHFSLFLGKWDYSIGFQSGQIQSGRSILRDIRVEEWGKVVLQIGNLELAWRDADYTYMFYPDKVILRPNAVGKADIYLYFSYAFTYSNLLQEFKDVEHDPQTSYWHSELSER